MSSHAAGAPPRQLDRERLEPARQPTQVPTLTRDSRLALDLALCGAADDLADPAGLTTRVGAHPDPVPDAAAFAAARRASPPHTTCGRPTVPSSPTLLAPRPRPVAAAVARLDAAARAPSVPLLHWLEGADPAVRTRAADGAHDLTAALAQVVIAFLAGPDRCGCAHAARRAACAASSRSTRASSGASRHKTVQGR
ncbi:hypothetical protein [Streptomyces sp. NPDC001537]